MLNNGSISFVTETGGGFDASGNPTASTKTLSAFIPCSINTVTKEYTTTVDGQVRQAKYIVTVDNYRLLLLNLTGLKEVQLADNRSVNLGSFQVQSKENMDFVNSLKIVV